MRILGISAYYHDSAAALIEDGEIIAAAQEERFLRKKHYSDFPSSAAKFCLDYANLKLSDIDFVAFYDKPFLKFERLLLTYINEAPRGFKSFRKAIPVWLKEKLFLKKSIIDELKGIGGLSKKEIDAKVKFAEHHISHCASAFYPSPFDSAAIVTSDGVGEWATSSIAFGDKNDIEILEELHFPHSLGLLYSAFTYFCGFKVNDGEYKLMGLAPYGEPKYVDLIKDKLIDLKNDGSLKLNMEYFNYTVGLTMTNDKFAELFGIAPRRPESPLTQKYMDIAKSIQEVAEEAIIKTARHARKIAGSPNLCLAGGVALNCVANGKLLKENIFDEIWIQPAAGDAGGSVGAALALYYKEFSEKRSVSKKDKMKSAFLGPEYSDEEIKRTLDKYGAKYETIADRDELIDFAAGEIANQKIVGWFQGRMEFGPRALGARSILADPRSPEARSKINRKIKFREGFRPFAPSVLEEKAAEYFDLDAPSPYMILVADVLERRRKNVQEDNEIKGLDKLNLVRSEIPAVTHVDYSARIQTVKESDNPLYHRLIKKFEEKTGVPLVVNTSFNVRGEPIVRSPENAYKCFMKTEMDTFVVGSFVLRKERQPTEIDIKKWNR